MYLWFTRLIKLKTRSRINWIRFSIYCLKWVKIYFFNETHAFSVLALACQPIFDPLVSHVLIPFISPTKIIRKKLGPKRIVKRMKTSKVHMIWAIWYVPYHMVHIKWSSLILVILAVLRYSDLVMMWAL